MGDKVTRVFTFMLVMVVCNIFMAWALTEVGLEAQKLEFEMNVSAEGVPTDADSSSGVLKMLWDAATFNVPGLPMWVQVGVFGTMNILMGIALLFLLRGVG